MTDTLIQPYVEVPVFARSTLRRLDFTLSQATLDKTPKGWLRLVMGWKGGNAEQAKLMYPVVNPREVYSTFGRQYITYTFNELKTPSRAKGEKECKPAIIELGIETDASTGLRYKYRFSEEIPYGAILWFAPLDWENGEGHARIFNWVLPLKNGGKVAL